MNKHDSEWLYKYKNNNFILLYHTFQVHARLKQTTWKLPKTSKVSHTWTTFLKKITQLGGIITKS